MTKTALIILDGWGHGEKNNGNAIYCSKTTFVDSLYKKELNSELTTHGESVGLPAGQMGNSEVGHLNIGAGRIVYQDLTRINKQIRSKKIFNNTKLNEGIDCALIKNKGIHIIGLCSDGGIHSDINHLESLCDVILSRKVKHIYIHAITDGRDTDPKSGKKFISRILSFIENKKISLSTVTGRYYAMDRDKRWERTSLAYHVMVNNVGIKTNNILKSIDSSYEKKITDEFLHPHVCTDAKNNPISNIKDDDVVICFNFRSDRCRQIIGALSQFDIPQYQIKSLNINLYTMTCYDDTYKNINVLFKKEHLKNTLGEIVSKNDLSQLRISETEKYPHVTYFFSGGNEQKFKNESRILIESPKVATYDLKPEMSSGKVTERTINEINAKKYDFICLNFANTDMVGHTGDFKAVVNAVEKVDTCLDKIVKACKNNNYVIVVIADHGNAEYMVNEDGSINTSHTTNKVPIFVINSKFSRLKNGKLCDVAPTILSLMKINIPTEMTGKNLLS